MTTVPISEAQAHLPEVAASIEDTEERVTITREGHPPVVLVTQAYLESLEETLEIMSDPELVRELRQAKEEVARGEVFVGRAELEKIMDARRRAGR